MNEHKAMHAYTHTAIDAILNRDITEETGNYDIETVNFMPCKSNKKTFSTKILLRRIYKRQEE